MKGFKRKKAFAARTRAATKTSFAATKPRLCSFSRTWRTAEIAFSCDRHGAHRIAPGTRGTLRGRHRAVARHDRRLAGQCLRKLAGIMADQSAEEAKQQAVAPISGRSTSLQDRHSSGPGRCCARHTSPIPAYSRQRSRLPMAGMLKSGSPAGKV